MLNRTARSPGTQERRQWPTLSIVIAGAAAFIALGGSAVAAKSLIRAGNIATGAVTSKAIKDGGVKLKDLSKSAKASLQGAPGLTGNTGNTGATGTPGANGANGIDGADGTDGAPGANGANGIDGADGTDGAPGANGANGAPGANGANGANGPNGANGANGANGTDGTDGTDGIDGTDGVDGIDGIDGTDGVIAPLSATNGSTALPLASPPTVVVTRAVPSTANYVVWAKTQLTHTGAADTIDCTLKEGFTTIDQVSMKTLPALAAIPVSLQAVTTTSPSQLSVECDVAVATGTASSSSLIAIPIG